MGSCCACSSKKSLPKTKTTLIQGLDGAGKTSILNSFTDNNSNKNNDPNLGFYIEVVQHNGITFSFWDLNGGRFIFTFGIIIKLSANANQWTQSPNSILSDWNLIYFVISVIGWHI